MKLKSRFLLLLMCLGTGLMGAALIGLRKAPLEDAGRTDKPPLVIGDGGRPSHSWNSKLGGLRLGMHQADVEGFLNEMCGEGVPFTLSEVNGFTHVVYSLDHNHELSVKYAPSRTVVTFSVRRVPPPSAPRPFADLRKEIPAEDYDYVKLIHESASIFDFDWDPLVLVRALNQFLALPQARVVRVLRTYERLAFKSAVRSVQYDLDTRRLIPLMLLLFESEDRALLSRLLLVDRYYIQVSAGQDNEWPHFPLTLVKDLPFTIMVGYNYFGVRESYTRHLIGKQHPFHLRKAPLAPTGSPLAAVDQLRNSHRWQRLFATQNNQRFEEDAILTLRAQALRTLKTSKLLSVDAYDCFFPASTDADDPKWRYLRDHFPSKRLRWNSNTGSYAFVQRVSPSN
jgi:hypothetical protein